MWTVQRIKDEFPEVDVVLPNGRIVKARPLGRMLPFSRVSWRDNDGVFHSVEVAWSTLADCLNANRPIIV